MKKKIFATLLTASLATSMLPAANAAVDSGDASAYLKAINNRPNASSYLVDFDSDGADELVLVWNGTDQVTEYEVWRGATLLGRGDGGAGGSVFLTEKDGQCYLMKDTPIGGDEVIAYFTMRAGTWTLTDNLTSAWYEGIE
ncbi:MAG: hypothetical protein Q3Y08_11625 [Butyricicoccus sp.]|nr:hypothetical protein [Butyricicoccus sp.]